MQNLDDKRKEKIIQELENEEMLLQQSKSKKVPQHIIKESVNRLYNEAERRKLSRECRQRQMKLLDEDDKNKENTPTKYKQKVKEHIYNFMVLYHLFSLIVKMRM
jgi:hypothetical protein